MAIHPFSEFESHYLEHLGKGIGKLIALRLADDGFDVAVNDIPSSAASLNEVVENIQAKGRASSAHLADVSVEDQVKQMIEEVVTAHGGLDVVRLYSLLAHS